MVSIERFNFVHYIVPVSKLLSWKLQKVENAILPKLTKHFENLAVVVVQLVEQLLPTPQIRGVHLAIGNFYLLSTVKTKINQKRPRMAQF